MGENKYPRMLIVQVWNIFSGFFLSDKKTHACLKTYVEILINFVKLVNHHTSPMNILGFFPIPKLGLTVVMRNNSLTTQRKRYTVKTVTRRRPIRVVSTQPSPLDPLFVGIGIYDS